MQSLAVVRLLKGRLNADFLAHFPAVPPSNIFAPEVPVALDSLNSNSCLSQTGLLVSVRAHFSCTVNSRCLQGKFRGECESHAVVLPFSQGAQFLKSCLYWLLSSAFKQFIYIFCLAFLVVFGGKTVTCDTGYIVMVFPITHIQTHTEHLGKLTR